MLFNSLGFLFVFLPIVLTISFRLRGQRLLQWITLSSFCFYAFAGHVWFLLPMLFTTVLDFYLAPLMQVSTGRRRKAILCLSLMGNLGLLFYFKYSSIVINAIEAVFPFGVKTGFLKVILPAGISFYTFQTLSYIIDVYRGEAQAERNIWKFTSFVSFFPHLVAGPLTRHNQLIPALESIAETGPRPRWKEGVFLFSVGLAKKVLIADRIANLIDPALNAPGQMTVMTAWFGLLGYTLQIYFDFSGYSDMAIGLGRLFGIELPQNFNSPYKATDPSDFWRRWHMSLSSWLRDYLYVSLGGNRCSPAKRNFNLMVTMVLGGLWHGANWTFALWGFYHGALLILYHRTQSFWRKMPVILCQGLTFFMVMLGWLFFRSESFANIGVWLVRLSGWHTAFGASELVRSVDSLSLVVLLMVGVALLTLPNASSFESFCDFGPNRQLALGLITLSAMLFMNYSSRFLYFQF